MDVERYVFEDADGTRDTFTTFDATEAREYAQKNGRRWIALKFEYTDYEIVENYTDTPPDEDKTEEMASHRM